MAPREEQEAQEAEQAKSAVRPEAVSRRHRLVCRQSSDKSRETFIVFTHVITPLQSINLIEEKVSIVENTRKSKLEQTAEQIVRPSRT